MRGVSEEREGAPTVAKVRVRRRKLTSTVKFLQDYINVYYNDSQIKKFYLSAVLKFIKYMKLEPRHVTTGKLSGSFSFLHFFIGANFKF